jgi:FkbM family methyltransferase
MSEKPFIDELMRELVHNRLNHFTDNYDTIQLGKEPPAAPPVWSQCASEFKQRLMELARHVIQIFKSVTGPIKRFMAPVRNFIQFLKPFLRPVKRLINYYILPKRYFKRDAEQFRDISFLHLMLGNQTSRDLLVKLFAYRILGYKRVKLPRNYPQYWEDIRGMEKYKTAELPINIKFMDLSLVQYDFKPLGYDLKVFATDPGSACAFVQKQYEYHHENIHCKAESGDIAIDAGGCWGETTMYFAHEVGPQGKVVSFEFIPSNLAVMRENLKRNPSLAQRVIVMENPIWSHSGLNLYYVDWGPGSRITEDEKQYQYDGTCATISIDDMVFQENLPKVDFIKMDIEGAEFPALQGAEQTIRKYRPKLAISLYHQLSDFVTIPKWLYELNLGYDFYLDHHTIYQNETVLFAIPRRNFEINP